MQNFILFLLQRIYVSKLLLLGVPCATPCARIELLLAHGADPALKDATGLTPLQGSASKVLPQALQLLLTSSKGSGT